MSPIEYGLGRRSSGSAAHVGGRPGPSSAGPVIVSPGWHGRGTRCQNRDHNYTHRLSCRSQVVDAGLAHLETLTGLIWLQLSGTQVTDAGLVHLHELKSLRELDVGDTEVTDTGLAELKRALPDLKIR